MINVCVNAGHTPTDRLGKDDFDCGAVNKRSGSNESTYNSLIARRCVNALRTAGYNARFFQSFDLDAIVHFSNAMKSNYFVSVHCNAFDEKTSGFEVLYHPQSPVGMQLACKIKEQIAKTLNLSNRGIKARGDLRVLNNTNCPAVLVECAFIDNDDDDNTLRLYYKAFGDAIARGISDLTAVLQTENNKKE